MDDLLSRGCPVHGGELKRRRSIGTLIHFFDCPECEYGVAQSGDRQWAYRPNKALWELERLVSS